MTVPIAYIIEDDQVISKIFDTAVREAHYQTEAFFDGNEALEKLTTGKPDLVVLDLHLPGVSGLQVLKAIRSDDRLEGTRVIIVSADATLSEYLRDEADLVLIKPVGFFQLREMAVRMRPPLEPS